MKFALAAALLCLASPALAMEEDAATRTQRWTDLKHAVFGDRVVTESTGLILRPASRS